MTTTPRRRLLWAAAAAAGLLLIATVELPSQQRFTGFTPPDWEYATVTGYASGFNASICYANTSAGGCRVDIVAGGLARSMALLGNDGWEQTAATVAADGIYVMYFKRPKPAQ